VGLGELRQLEALQAEGCQLVQPFASMYAKDPLMLVKVHDVLNQTLDLSELELEQVPSQILRLSGLTSLNLSKNAIKVSSSDRQDTFSAASCCQRNVRGTSIEALPLAYHQSLLLTD
jgi:Leucine-rich repeat (LRR) protein